MQFHGSIDVDSLRVNADYVRHIQRVAGLGHIGVSGDAWDRNVITEWGADPVAWQTEKVRLSGMPKEFPQYNRPESLISVHEPEFYARVTRRLDRGTTPTQAVASELDGSLKRGLRMAANQNLWSEQIGRPGEQTVMNALMITAFGFGPSIAEFRPAGLGLAAVHGLFYGPQIVGELRRNRATDGNYHLHGRRWSAFPGAAQPDRLLAAHAALRLPRRIITAVESSE